MINLVSLGCHHEAKKLYYSKKLISNPNAHKFLKKNKKVIQKLNTPSVLL